VWESKTHTAFVVELMPTLRRVLAPALDVACAAGLALVMVVGSGWLLWRLPSLSPATAGERPAQLRWLLPVPPAGLPVASPLPPAVVLPVRPAIRAGSMPALPSGPPPDRATLLEHSDAPPPLFDRTGRAQLPAQARADGVDGRSSAQRLFERRHGTAMDRPQTGMSLHERPDGAGQSRTQRALFGRDVQAARARPAPAVAFHPALHERRSDLASSAGAQAYLAAAIADAPAPGLEGQASAQLLPQQRQRQRQVQACALPALGSAWQALQQHLALLQRAEQRMTHGSSPQERAHSLTHEIGRQYNLARRALWQVDQLLPQCLQQPGRQP